MENTLTSNGYRVKSREDIALLAPAAMSKEISPVLTERYSYFSTEQFLDAFEKLGWMPYSVKQNGVGPYSRHIIRFHNPDMGFLPVEGDKIRPQLILDNSHDGFTKARIHLGLFRVVSETGMVISIPGLKTKVKFLHVGVNQKEMMEIIADTAEQYRQVASHINEMIETKMTEGEKLAFAMKAIALRDTDRFMQADKKTIDEDAINAAIDIYDIIEPIRPQDEAEDLWTLFNLVQERTVNGMFEQKSAKGRKSYARPITNAARNLEYNKQLWDMAQALIEKN